MRLAAAENPDGTYNETVGGNANTWTNYTNAGGYQGPTIPAYATVEIACVVQGFRVADGNTNWYLIASSPWNYQYYVSADAFYNNGQTSGSLLGTPFVDPAVPSCNTPVNGVPETAGGAANTWTNYMNAGGTQGPTVGGGATVIIACKLHGFQVADGNTWWYQIASRPWNNGYYVSADAFYNNGQTSGSLVGTPFVDPNVPDCTTGGGGGSGGVNETVGGNANTWTNYTNAGGTEGPTIPAGTTVSITCKLQGFQVADGNTWWYQIGSSPWSNNYYVSADAFYNNGQTSGSLRGTPFVDYAVPDCTPSGGSGGTGGGGGGARGSTEVTGGYANTWTNYSDAGGVAGPGIPGGTSVNVTCRVQGFRVADGNTWWYLLSSPPWADYYVSADPFYNNGATSGGLAGTPFYDSAVPICTAEQEALAYATSLATGSSSSHSPTCTYGAYPVNCASGDFWHDFTDVSISGRGPGLQLTRTYNSLSPSSEGMFGYGWSSSYDQHLLFNSDGRSDGSIAISQGDGSQLTATPNGSGGYSTPPFSDSAFQSNSDGSYTLTLHHLTLERFSSSGQLLSIADLTGNQTTLAYNSSGQLSTVTDSSGRTLSFAFGANGLVSSVTDPMGRTTSYAYDSAADLTSTTDPMGRVWAFSYDSNHRMLMMTDPRGGTVTNTYDGTGRVTAQVDPAGLKTSFAYTGDNYGPVGGTTTITDPHGNVRLEQYANGFLTQVTHALGAPEQATSTYSYDPNTYGQTSATDPNGHVTSRTYDSTGHVLASTDGTGAVTTYTYNPLGEVATTTTPRGEVTTNTYNAAGNLVSTQDPLGNTTNYAYGDATNPGLVTSITDAAGHVTGMTYDSHGDLASRTVSPSSGVSDTTTYAYDDDSEPVCEASPNASAAHVMCPAAGSPRVADTTTTVYDGDGEVTAATDPNGHTTSYSYDADGNKTGVIDGAGNETTYTYDADNRRSSVTFGANAAGASTTSTAYDIAAGSGACPSGQEVSYCATSTDPNGHVTVDVFDAADREIQTIRPGAHATTYTYDLAGNKLTEAQPDGDTVTYAYDAANRLTGVSYSDGTTPSVSYTYNADGQRTSMTDGTGTTSYAYDADGRATSVTNGAGQTIGYGYDPAGDLTAITYPNGQKVNRGYDGAGRMSSVTDWLGNTTSFSYDADGNLTATTYPNGDTIASSYDGADHLMGTRATASGSLLAGIAYQRTAADLISHEQDGGSLAGNFGNTYNAQNQLTQMGARQMRYDAAGNLTWNFGMAQSFDAADELTTATGGGETLTYGYDANGNRAKVTPTWGRILALGANGANELTSVSLPAATPIVTALSPSSGSYGGGTGVTITGHGFTEATGVSFGGTPATGIDVVSDSKIVATAPSRPAGPTDVTVTGPGGTSATGGADAFTYSNIPALTDVAPQAGATSGGGTVTLTGVGFTGATHVYFGKVAAPSVTVVSDTTIKATVPAGSGTVHITVRTANGTNAGSVATSYSYINGAAITSVAPSAGPTAGGTTVTIQGTGFTGATAVSFGVVPATNVNVVSDNTIQADAPAGTGSTDVTVTTPTSTSAAVSADRFTYAATPSVTTVYPLTGPTSGGNTVAITGTGLSGPNTAVSFGSTQAAIKVVSSTEILAIAPPGTGTQNVTVETAGGQSQDVTGESYSYVAAPSSYAYNGDGLRMSATTGSGTANYAWDTTPSVPELLNDGANSYLYGPGGLVIEQIDTRGTPSYYFHDALGSTRALFAQSGSVSATYTYSAYGRLIRKTGSASTSIGFAGAYTDPGDGLDYLVARYYDPDTGQFLAVDPALATSNAAYGYGADDPSNVTDPSGLFPSLEGLWNLAKQVKSAWKDNESVQQYNTDKNAYNASGACANGDSNQCDYQLETTLGGAIPGIGGLVVTGGSYIIGGIGNYINAENEISAYQQQTAEEEQLLQVILAERHQREFEASLPRPIAEPNLPTFQLLSPIC